MAVVNDLANVRIVTIHGHWKTLQYTERTEAAGVPGLTCWCTSARAATGRIHTKYAFDRRGTRTSPSRHPEENYPRPGFTRARRILSIPRRPRPRAHVTDPKSRTYPPPRRPALPFTWRRRVISPLGLYSRYSPRRSRARLYRRLQSSSSVHRPETLNPYPRPPE